MLAGQLIDALVQSIPGVINHVCATAEWGGT